MTDDFMPGTSTGSSCRSSIRPACGWSWPSCRVVRFLSYLDLRIRHEGWEVELLMRAEALRLATQME